MAFQNPLHEFRSYSYHHILVACNTTEVAESIIQNVNGLMNSKGMSNPLTDTPSDKAAVKQQDQGDYIVVINGMHDADFFIRSAHWSTILAPGEASEASNMSITGYSVEGQIEIIEPRGFRFMNAVTTIANKLKTNPLGIVWVLKTIFIGYKDNSSVGYITNIKPLMFMMVDITGEFDEGGSLYTLSIVGTSNGASKLPMFNTHNVVTTTVEPSSLVKTLQAAIVALQDNYNNLITQAKSPETVTDYYKEGRKIRYALDVDPYYSRPEYSMDNRPASLSGTGGHGGQVSFSTDSIEDMIDSLMLNSKQVLKESTTAGERFIPKIHSVITSNKSEAIVTFVIRRTRVSETTTQELDGYTEEQFNMALKNRNKPADSGETQGAIQTSRNAVPAGPVGSFEAIEFDYLYTGRNVDVLKFDLKMNQGLMFFQTLMSQGNALDNQNTITTTEDPVVAQQIAGGAVGSAVKTGNLDILIPPKLDKSAANTNKNYGLVGFQEALSRHAACETLTAKLRIAGNPYLLDNFNILPSQVGQSSSGPGIPNWHTLPALCKVNISMPSNNSLLGVGGPQSSFQTKFWYDGYYSILQVEHDFSNGLFTQELELISLPTFASAATEAPSVVSPSAEDIINSASAIPGT